jgi:hypothetical protein
VKPPEHPEPGEQLLLARVEQPVAPDDGVAHRLLPLGEVRPVPAQELEPVAEAREQVLGPQQLHPRRDQLDGERQAVQAAADLRHRLRVVLPDREAGTYGPRPLDEEAHGVVGAHLVEGAVAGEAQRVDRELVLALDVQDGAARDDDGEARAAPEELGHQRGGIGQLLEVVEDHERAAVAEEVPDHLEPPRVAAGAGGAADAEAERPHHGGRDQGRVLDRRERDEEGPSGEALAEAAGGLYGEPGLAHASGPRERDQADVLVRQPLRERRELVVPADHEARRRRDGTPHPRLHPLLLRLEALGQERHQVLGHELLELGGGGERLVRDHRLLLDAAQHRLQPGLHVGSGPLDVHEARHVLRQHELVLQAGDLHVGGDPPVLLPVHGEEHVALLQVGAVQAAGRMRPRGLLEQHGRELEGLDRALNGGSLLRQLAHRRADEHSEALVGGEDHARGPA